MARNPMNAVCPKMDKIALPSPGTCHLGPYVNPIPMKRLLPIPASFLAIALLSSCWSNQNGAAGTTDGTNTQAYELNAKENLATSMDSTAAPAPAAMDSAKAPADSTAAH